MIKFTIGLEWVGDQSLVLEKKKGNKNVMSGLLMGKLVLNVNYME